MQELLKRIVFYSEEIQPRIKQTLQQCDLVLYGRYDLCDDQHFHFDIIWTTVSLDYQGYGCLLPAVQEAAEAAVQKLLEAFAASAECMEQMQ